MANKHARLLRKTMTRQEVKLWVHLRTWRTKGFHFRRQVPRGDHIVDFACLRRKLIVEVEEASMQWNLVKLRTDSATNG
jgi:very-short-patch-repair endonuclease